MRHRGLLLICSLLAGDAWAIGWTLDKQARLPAGIALYRGEGDGLCAVAAVVDAGTQWRLGWFPDAAVTPLAFARSRSRSPYIVINGGYFDARTSMSVLIENGTTLAPGRYQSVRAALGATRDGSSEIRPFGDNWQPWRALGGGPMLVENGAKRLGTGQELFDARSGIGADVPAPRSAVALLDGGKLLLMVVDGRSAHSRGVALDELAGMLLAFGARAAMNLDGGGSSVMLVNGEPVSHPSDAAGMRPVRSVLWIGEDD